MRIAAFDFGTVTTRLLFADVGSLAIDERVRRTTITLKGEGLSENGLISPAACQRILATCQEYLALAALHAQDTPIRLAAVGTSALRDAQNRDDLLGPLDKLGINPLVISGSEEARLSFWGALSGFTDGGESGGARVDGVPGAPESGSAGRASGPDCSSDTAGTGGTRANGRPGLTLVVDIGGGSTELIAGQATEDPSLTWAERLASSQIQQSHSFDVGARRLTDRFLRSDPPTPAELEAARDWVRSLFSPWFSELRAQGWSIGRILAVAGTATTVVSIRDQMAVYDPGRVHGSRVSRPELLAVTQQLAALPLAARRQVVGLEPGRASVVIGGLLVLEVVLELAGSDGYIASESDILRGIVLDTWISA